MRRWIFVGIIGLVSIEAGMGQDPAYYGSGGVDVGPFPYFTNDPTQFQGVDLGSWTDTGVHSAAKLSQSGLTYASVTGNVANGLFHASGLAVAQAGAYDQESAESTITLQEKSTVVFSGAAAGTRGLVGLNLALGGAGGETGEVLVSAEVDQTDPKAPNLGTFASLLDIVYRNGTAYVNGLDGEWDTFVRSHTYDSSAQGFYVPESHPMEFYTNQFAVVPGPATLTLTMTLRVDASQEIGFVQNSADFSHTFSFTKAGSAFTVPNGWSVDSSGFSIVNNRLQPVPEPAPLTVLGVSLLAFLRRRSRR